MVREKTVNMILQNYKLGNLVLEQKQILNVSSPVSLTEKNLLAITYTLGNMKINGMILIMVY
jgi:hypothetical protein